MELRATPLWMTDIKADGPSEFGRVLALAIAGDVSAFEQIVIRYERRVLTLAWRLLGSGEDAQDASQEVFLRAFRFLHRFDASRPFEPWLIRLTVNVCRDIGRKRTPSVVLEADMLQAGSDPHSEFSSEEQRRVLHAALQELPEKERSAVVLRDIEGFSTAEVAEMLGLERRNSAIADQHRKVEDQKGTGEAEKTMNCRLFENDLALYVEGDLPRAKADEVDAHLRTCATCQCFVDELRETQSMFKSIRQEMVSPRELTRLRMRVLEQVAAQKVKLSWGRWVYALAGVAFVLSVAVGVFSRFTHRVPEPVQVVATDPLPQAAPVAVPLSEGDSNTRPPVQPLRKGHRRSLGQGVSQAEAPKPAAPPQQIMVKLLTDDPNIVIYWLVDKNGGSL